MNLIKFGPMKKYKSPSHKLITFFENSRNQWKAKYVELKNHAKYLKNRISFLTRSKEYWKNKAKELEEQLRNAEKDFAKEKADHLEVKEALQKKRPVFKYR